MQQEFDHKTANISDKITALGELEHALYHARKAAANNVGTEKEIYYQAVARMCLDLRREYMRKYFPDCTEDSWCLGKAIEIARQRIYEADEGDAEYMKKIDEIWNLVWAEIAHTDLSGCASCREDMSTSSYEIPEAVIDQSPDDGYNE